jgi:DNA mismatch repair protein MutL
MPRIRQLPPQVVTKIAAGEVIERPASVVKELLENAVDAGATRVDVELDQAGVERIAVADDGCGIDAEDLTLVFASHATSKLADAEDLFRVRTLGFRGEAMSSIAGVARVQIQTRPRGAHCGSEVHCFDGSLSAVKPWNGSHGTRVEVKHLFATVPARKKFLKAAGTELGHASETFTRLALAHPAIHWTLTHNGRRVYEVPASAALPERIGLFFGAEVRDQLLEVRATQGPVTLSGFVADPACDRGHARMQYLFVNGRWVRDRSLGHAVQEAFRGLLMTGRYAVGFLFLEVPPDTVDVNVHPTKSEVRFRDAQQLYHLVRAAVRETLSRASLVPRLQAPPEEPGARGERRGASEEPPAFRPRDDAPQTPPRADVPLSPRADAARLPAPWEAPPPLPPPPAIAAARSAFSAPSSDLLNAIQVHDSYLVVETPEGMLVIDQHALHERILFEQIKRRIAAGQLERQRLLIPEPVDLTAEQAARVLEHRAALDELGLEVEDFGGGTVLLSSYPAMLTRTAPADILKGVIDQLLSRDRPPVREQLLNDLMATMACKAAVKAGDRLTPEEIAALLAQRALADDTHHCPHGRPTSLLFSRHDLDRQFRRI